MKLTFVLITLGILPLSAAVFSQTIRFDGKNVLFSDALNVVLQQTDYLISGPADIMKTNKKITVSADNMPLTEYVGFILQGLPIEADYVGKTIVLSKKKFASETFSAVQQQQVSGRVYSDDNEPLAGVTVKVKGSSTVVTTDNQGTFRIPVAGESAVLVFSHVGYTTKEEITGQRTMIQLTLVKEQNNLDQVVVIGYDAVRKTDLTGAVGQANMQDLAKAPVGNFAEALAGRVAGVKVASNDGQPGGGINIMIRGAGSLTQSTAPLYVVDGFPIEDLDPATLNTEDIESLTVLKDASSAAIYGSRAANGVVLIETKRGRIGKPEISFSTSQGYQLEGNKIALMSPYEFLKYQSELSPNTPSTLSYFQNGKTLEDYRNVKGIDWGSQVINNGSIGNYSLSLRGGNEQTRYAVSGSLFDQNGLVINTGFQRYSGRVTLDQKISSKINTGITLNYSGVHSNGQIISAAAGNSSPTTFVLFRTWAYRPIHGRDDVDLLVEEVDDESVNTLGPRINPVIDLQNQHQVNQTNTLDGNGFITYSPGAGLTFKSTVGFRHLNIIADRFFNSKTSQGSLVSPSNLNGINGSMRITRAVSYSNENTVSWRKTISGDHRITGLGLFAVNTVKSRGGGYGGRMLPNEVLGMSGIDEGLAYLPTSAFTNNGLLSYATRWDYNFKSKYLLTVNFRADGSSKFVDHWGYFPGAAIAWNMDKEDFFKSSFPFISTSKIRASYGSTGNNRVTDFATYATLVQTINGYSFNNETPVGSVNAGAMGNTDLMWEKVITADIGYEIGLFNNRVSAEFDVYRRVTDNLLLQAVLPPTIGFASAMKNIGELKNEGLEFTLNTTNIDRGSFRWMSSFNIAFNKNTIIRLADGESGMPTTVAYEPQFTRPLYLSEVGKPAGMMIGFIWEGNYQYEDFNSPSPGIYILKPHVPTNGGDRTTIQPGDVKYRDLNNDGVVDDYDLTFIGRGQPIHTGGFNNNFTYKGFDLNVFFQWSYGNDLFNANRLSLEGNANNYPNMNQFAAYANRWTPENQNNDYYRTRGGGPLGVFSSRVVEDGSFLRLKTVSLSYSLPQQFIRRAHLTNFSINVSAQNLLTWTSYTGLDPEVSTRNPVLSPGFDYSAYPQARTVTIGLRAGF